MQIEPWQIPVLVAGGIILLEIVVRAIARRRHVGTLAVKQVRTAALVVLALLLLVIFVRAVGTSTADRLASVASAVMELVALWLAYQSYRELKAAKAEMLAADEDAPEGQPDNQQPAPAADPVRPDQR